MVKIGPRGRLGIGSRGQNRSLEPTWGGSGGQMHPKSQEDTEKFVRGPFVDPPLGAVLGPKTGFVPEFVVSFSAYFFEGLSDAFGDRFLDDFEVILGLHFHALVVLSAKYLKW